MLAWLGCCLSDLDPEAVKIQHVIHLFESKLFVQTVLKHCRHSEAAREIEIAQTILNQENIPVPLAYSSLLAATTCKSLLIDHNDHMPYRQSMHSSLLFTDLVLEERKFGCQARQHLVSLT